MWSFRLCSHYNSIYQQCSNAVSIANPLAFIHPAAVKRSFSIGLCLTCASIYENSFSSQYRRQRKLVGSLLAGWDFLPCVTVSVIAMSHFKDFMWADGWSATRERPVVKIPINEGQRNMTWTASGPYLPATQPVDWNCIPSALGHGSVLNVSAGILPSPRILAHAHFLLMNSQL